MYIINNRANPKFGVAWDFKDFSAMLWEKHVRLKMPGEKRLKWWLPQYQPSMCLCRFQILDI